MCVAGRRRWGDDDSDDDELTVDAVRRARAAAKGGTFPIVVARGGGVAGEESKLKSTVQLAATARVTQMAGATVENMRDQVRRQPTGAPS